jgi:hypothetical protein
MQCRLVQTTECIGRSPVLHLWLSARCPHICIYSNVCMSLSLFLSFSVRAYVCEYLHYNMPTDRRTRGQKHLASCPILLTWYVSLHERISSHSYHHIHACFYTHTHACTGVSISSPDHICIWVHFANRHFGLILAELHAHVYGFLCARNSESVRLKLRILVWVWHVPYVCKYVRTRKWRLKQAMYIPLETRLSMMVSLHADNVLEDTKRTYVYTHTKWWRLHTWTQRLTVFVAHFERVNKIQNVSGHLGRSLDCLYTCIFF